MLLLLLLPLLLRLLLVVLLLQWQLLVRVRILVAISWILRLLRVVLWMWRKSGTVGSGGSVGNSGEWGLLMHLHGGGSLWRIHPTWLIHLLWRRWRVCVRVAVVRLRWQGWLWLRELLKLLKLRELLRGTGTLELLKLLLQPTSVVMVVGKWTGRVVLRLQLLRLRLRLLLSIAVRVWIRWWVWFQTGICV